MRMSPLASSTVTDAERRMDVELCNQYVVTVIKQHVKIDYSVVLFKCAKHTLKKYQKRRIWEALKLLTL